jgi:5-methyltetrahydrofolate--homocysteine methyltransferase
MEKLIGLMRPTAAEKIDEETVKKAARLAAFHLQHRRLVFDNKQERSFDLSFRILPSSLRVSLSVKPASKGEVKKHSLRPSAKRGAVQAMIEEINALIENGNMQDALGRAKEVHSLPTEYRVMIARGILEKFARLGREIGEEERFFIPRLLAAHRAFSCVLNDLKPYVEPGTLPSPRGTVALASIQGDSGQGKDIVADILSVTGHRVTDLGANMEPEEIVRSLVKRVPEVLTITALVPINLRLASDTLSRTRTCRRAVRELMARLAQEGMRDRLEILLVGFAFNRKFGREMGIDAVCRTLRSLFLECRKGAAKKRKK